MRAVVTVIGKDKKGIIYFVSKCLHEMNINIEDISQTILQGFFMMMMVVDISQASCDFSTVLDTLKKAGEENAVDIKIQHEDIFNKMHKL